MSNTMTDTTADNGDQVTAVEDVFYAGRRYQHLVDTQAFERGEGAVPVPLPVD
jgi:hypothetical protein